MFNFGPELSSIISQLGMNTNTPSATYFDLPNLDKHNVFDHDASLSQEQTYDRLRLSGPPYELY